MVCNFLLFYACHPAEFCKLARKGARLEFPFSFFGQLGSRLLYKMQIIRLAKHLSFSVRRFMKLDASSIEFFDREIS